MNNAFEFLIIKILEVIVTTTFSLSENPIPNTYSNYHYLSLHIRELINTKNVQLKGSKS